MVGADVTDPARQVSFQVAPDGEGGAVWQSGGAPAVDAAGNLYVSTGIANPDPPEGGPDPKRYTESVVELGPDLRPRAAYKDTTAGGDAAAAIPTAVRPTTAPPAGCSCRAAAAACRWWTSATRRWVRG